MRAPLRHRLTVLALAAALAAPALAAPSRVSPAVNAQDRAAIIDDISAALNEIYVFPETARKMEEHVRRQLKAGSYDRLGTLDVFTQKLTEDLQSVSHDLHLRVSWDPEAPPGDAGEKPTVDQQARFAARLRRDNYCFRKIEHLAGNVGYLKLDCFAPAELGGGTAVAAMGFLAGSDALIFDLRDNGGGDPTMIQLLTSYLVGGEPAHLNSFYIRKGDKTQQFWTQAWVPGTRLPDVPVFVLTSNHTFSAAEEFTYNLKNMKRATIVGETTGGGAHPVDLHRVKGYPVAVSLPFGRAINPISGTNWEGTGVEPDVKTQAPEALAVAHARALTAVAEKATDPRQKAEIEFTRGMVEDRGKPPASLSPAELQAFAGTYGPRTITLDNGTLWYQRGKGRRQRLLPLGQDRFLVGDLEDFRLRFERDASGTVVRLVGLYADGTEEPSARGGE
ncbi:MAG TPA: S41 family peptidase [Thermoanaerobaculia bacterium]|nr:S41 family peptidase [Thermoanaerobaculia bacterium]